MSQARTPERSDTAATLVRSPEGSSSRTFESPPPAKERRLAEACRAAEADERRRARLAECAASSRLACGAAERDGRKGEDVAVVAPSFIGSDDFYAVYDGHRGRAVASHAARTLHCELATALAGGASDVPRALADAFARCNADAEAQQLLDGAAAVVFVALGARGWVANAGDCRAVLHAGPGAVSRLSVDHRASEPSERARVEAAGGTVEFDNLEGMLAVSRGLGDFDFARSGFSCEPHVAGPIDLGANDGGGGAPSEAGRFVLLASDGVFDVMSDDEACALVAASLADGTPPADACRALLQNASARGSRDDKAAIVVRLGAAAAAEAARSTSCEI